jgi:hypothetical protein
VNLRSLQEDFRNWLTMESADASARLGEQARPGLAVYLNNYRSQLMACLAESFPAVRSWLGASRFDAAAATHIDGSPPHAWTLDTYPADFPATLAVLHPAEPVVTELARLEQAVTEAFIGPDATPLDPASLGDIDWDSAVIHLAPTLAMLPVTTNVAAIWSAISAGEPMLAAKRLSDKETIAIWRRQFTPMFRIAKPLEAAIVEQLRAGQTFGAICAALVEQLGEDPGTAAAAEILRGWLRDGLIVGISAKNCTHARRVE